MSYFLINKIIRLQQQFKPTNLHPFLILHKVLPRVTDASLVSTGLRYLSLSNVKIERRCSQRIYLDIIVHTQIYRVISQRINNFILCATLYLVI